MNFDIDFKIIFFSIALCFIANHLQITSNLPDSHLAQCIYSYD